MPHKIGHAQQIVQNYFATLMMQPVTLNFSVELLCSLFNALCFFSPVAKKLNHYGFFILTITVNKRKIKLEEFRRAVVEGGLQIKLSQFGYL